MLEKENFLVLFDPLIEKFQIKNLRLILFVSLSLTKTSYLYNLYKHKQSIGGQNCVISEKKAKNYHKLNKV